MNSKPHQDEDDDNELVFQNLTPEQPANVFQKSIIHIQHNWNKRHLLILLTVLSSLLIFLLVFEFIYPSMQPNGTTNSITNSNAITTTNVAQMLSYANVIYVLINQPPSNNGQLEALNSKTGKLIWSYSHHNTEGIKLVGNILYIQTDTNLVALNANTRTQLWQNQTFSDANSWQVEQGILYTTSTSGIVIALNASTGAQLWKTQQPSGFWQVDDGIFYTAPIAGLGLSALNAYNGQQLWSNTSIDQGSTINSANINQDLTINNGHFYLQNNKNQSMQAYDGRNGKVLWQFDTHGKNFTLSAHDGFLVLSDVQETQVEVLNGQTGKMLWQRQGTINMLAEGPNQTVILSSQKNETDIIRTSDGTTLYHFPSSDALLSLENGIAFFIHFPLNDSNGNTALIINIEAIRISSGTTIWSSQSLDKTPLLQNNAIEIVSISNNSLLALRADNGQTLWEHTFAKITN